MPKPTKKAESVSCTSPADAPYSRPIAGRLGRYMSMESGPNAASMASTGRKKTAKAFREGLREEANLGGWSAAARRTAALPAPALAPIVSRSKRGRMEAMGTRTPEQRRH